MVGLLDIAPLSKKVQVGENQVAVYGVSALGIATLLQKFPELRKLMSGMELDTTPERLVQIVPEAIAGIIAAGCGYPGDSDAEETAERLPADVQLDLLEAVIELTMPKGARPFFEKLMAAMSKLDKDASAKIAAMQSQQQSKNSSEPASD